MLPAVHDVPQPCSVRMDKTTYRWSVPTPRISNGVSSSQVCKRSGWSIVRLVWGSDHAAKKNQSAKSYQGWPRSGLRSRTGVRSRGVGRTSCMSWGSSGALGLGLIIEGGGGPGDMGCCGLAGRETGRLGGRSGGTLCIHSGFHIGSLNGGAASRHGIRLVLDGPGASWQTNGISCGGRQISEEIGAKCSCSSRDVPSVFCLSTLSSVSVNEPITASHGTDAQIYMSERPQRSPHRANSNLGYSCFSPCTRPS